MNTKFLVETTFNLVVVTVGTLGVCQAARGLTDGLIKTYNYFCKDQNDHIKPEKAEKLDKIAKYVGGIIGFITTPSYQIILNSNRQFQQNITNEYEDRIRDYHRLVDIIKKMI